MKYGVGTTSRRRTSPLSIASGIFYPMHSEALALQDRLVRAMSPERKLLASEALRNAAWELKAARISSRHPDLTPVAVRERVRQIFLDVGS